LLLAVSGVLAIAAFVIMITLTGKEKTKPTAIEEKKATASAETKPEPEYFSEQNRLSVESFAFSFYYPKEWFVTDNGGYKEDKFIDINSTNVLAGYVLSSFNNPDYQLGKQATMMIKVFSNENKLGTVEWLEQNDKNAAGGAEISSIKLYLADFAIYTVESENQYYTSLASGEMLAFTAPCGVNSQCIGDKLKNQEIFDKVLSSLQLN